MEPVAIVLPEGSYLPSPLQGAIQTGVEETAGRFTAFEPHIFSSKAAGLPNEEKIENTVHHRIEIGLLSRMLSANAYPAAVSEQIKKLGIKLVNIRNRPRYLPVFRKALGGQMKIVLHEHNHNIADTMSIDEGRKILQMVDAYVGVSRFTRNYEITERFPEFFSKSHVILNGVNTGRFLPKNTRKDEADKIRAKYRVRGDKNILFVGALRERKGAPLLIDALPIILKKHPDAKLIICGGNADNVNASDAYAKQIYRDAGKMGGSVIFTGFIPSSQMQDMYLLGDISVVPSIWDEAFGLVAAEASSCGLPVIASKRGGLPEIVKDKETGLIVDNPENIDELAGKIMALLDDPALSERYGKAGRAFMEKEFTWKRVAKENEELFRRLLNGQ